MTSTFQASKQLHAIRKQLMVMEQLYRDEFHTEDVDGSSEENVSLGSVDVTEESTTNEETPNNTESNQRQTEFSEFQTCLEEPSFSTADDNEQVETMFFPLMEIPQHDFQESIPFSQEIRQDITTMEDIDDVDNFIDNVINSVQVDSSFDEDLYRVEQTVNNHSLEEDHIIIDESLVTENFHAKEFVPNTEEQICKKERIKKDNHNIIERRRRNHINDRIKDLADLLPPTTHPAMKLNKGSILKASVEYVKELKRDQKKLASFAVNQRAIEAKYQKMSIRIFRLELKMKLYGLYGLTRDDLFQTKKKKRPRRQFCEIDDMVEGLIKKHLPQKEKNDKKMRNRQVNRQSTSDVKFTGSTKVENVAKKGLRNVISKRMSSESTKNKNHIKISPCTSQMEKKSTEYFSSSRCEEYAGNIGHEINDKSLTSHTPDKQVNEELRLTIPEQTHSLQTEAMTCAELSLDQCNILLDLLGTDHLTICQADSVSVPSSSQNEEKSSSTLSPLSVTTNMLEELLRKSDKTLSSSGSPSSKSPSSSESSSLENSRDCIGHH